MSPFREVVIIEAKRTPVGSFMGKLSTVSAPQLGAIAIKAVLSETGIDKSRIDEVIMGNVISAGLGQAPGRQAALYAGLPPSVECLTLNKMCGSGLKSVMLASQAIQVGDADVIIAGGLENMSAAPYLIPKGRTGYRMGHGKILDSMIQDGLWDVYHDQHMGNCAELCARDRQYSREEQDAFATESYERAQAAQANGKFEVEIVPVDVPQRKGDPVTVSEDEEPGRANFEKMNTLRPAFEKRRDCHRSQCIQDQRRCCGHIGHGTGRGGRIGIKTDGAGDCPVLRSQSSGMVYHRSDQGDFQSIGESPVVSERY